MSCKIDVKLLGAFKKAYGSGEFSLRLNGKRKLADVVREIAEVSVELGRVLIDPELGDPRPNAVILVNGREISVLDGLETEIGDGDEIVLIPVIHGG
jgi:molybdopterin converting factor small subunit